MKRSAIVDHEIDVRKLIAEVSAPEHGAISVFLGTVRDTNEGRQVLSIDYSAYTSMAEAELERIVEEAGQLCRVDAIVVEHRIGSLALGDVSIAVVSAHQHRGPAIDCTRHVIEEIKTRVPIWKLEHYADGTRGWVETTRPADRAAV